MLCAEHEPGGEHEIIDNAAVWLVMGFSSLMPYIPVVQWRYIWHGGSLPNARLRLHNFRNSKIEQLLKF